MSKHGTDRILLLIYGLLAVGVMTAIFCLSQQSGDESAALSKAVLDEVKETGLDVFIPQITFGGASGGGGFHFALQGRKWAHFYLYALLGAAELLWWDRLIRRRDGRLLGWTVRRRLPWAAGLAFGFCLIYACTDEIHQLFVDSRSGRLGDLLYDATGFGLSILLALTAAGLVKLAAMLVRKRKGG